MVTERKRGRDIERNGRGTERVTERSTDGSEREHGERDGMRNIQRDR